MLTKVSVVSCKEVSYFYQAFSHYLTFIRNNLSLINKTATRIIIKLNRKRTHWTLYLPLKLVSFVKTHHLILQSWLLVLLLLGGVVDRLLLTALPEGRRRGWAWPGWRRRTSTSTTRVRNAGRRLNRTIAAEICRWWLRRHSWRWWRHRWWWWLLWNGWMWLRMRLRWWCMWLRDWLLLMGCHETGTFVLYVILQSCCTGCFFLPRKSSWYLMCKFK